MNLATAPLPVLAAGSSDAFIAELVAGDVLVVAAHDLAAATPTAIAAQGLLSALRAAGATPKVVEGVAVALPDVPAQAGMGTDHVQRWLAAGDALERLIARIDDRQPTHVVLTDPQLVTIESVLPGKPRRILIADLRALRSDDEDGYHAALRDWLPSAIDVLAPAELLIERFGAGVASAAVQRTQSAVLTKPSTGRQVLIEESADGAADAAALGRLIAEQDTSDRVLLVSPHVPHYQAEAPDLLERCLVALHPADLAAPVYASLLRSVDACFLPERPALGAFTDACLPPSVRRSVTAAATHHASIAKRVPEATAKPVTSPAPPPIRNGDSFATWWRHVGALMEAPDRRTEDLTREATDQFAPGRALALASSAQTNTADFAILVACHKYLQRFRIFLQSLVRQTHPLDRIELCVATFGNPDGIDEYLDLVRTAHPTLRLKQVACSEADGRYKGKLVNAAFRASAAPVVMVADGDLVLPRDFVATMLAEHRSEHIVGCWRTPLDRVLTAQIITGNLDPVENFDALRQQWSKEEGGDVRQGLLGYCQIVAREALVQVPYPEEFEGFGQSDIVFVERLQQRLGLTNRFLKERFVLHLSHHRDWTGTKVFL